MCLEPASMTLALSAASALSSAVGGTITAVQQANYNKALAVEQQRVIDETAAAARKSFETSTAATNLATQQAQEAAGQDIFTNKIEALRAKGTAVTAAGEANVSGLSVDALLADFEAQEGRFNTATRANLSGIQAQGELEKTAAHDLAAGRSASVGNFVAAPVEMPDYFSSVFGLGQSYLDYKEATRIPDG